jgi:hypothetical protein
MRKVRKKANGSRTEKSRPRVDLVGVVVLDSGPGGQWFKSTRPDHFSPAETSVFQ